MQKDSLTREEQETIILWNEAEATAEIYTHSPALIRRLDSLAAAHPEQFQRTEDNGNGGISFTMPKGLISIRQPVSDEARQAQRERALKSGRKPPTRRNVESIRSNSADEVV